MLLVASKGFDKEKDFLNVGLPLIVPLLKAKDESPLQVCSDSEMPATRGPGPLHSVRAPSVLGKG